MTFLSGGDAPDAVGVPAEVKLAVPSLAATGDGKPRGREAHLRLELVVKPVRKLRGANGNATCAHVLVGDVDLGELDAERVVLDPSDRSVSFGDGRAHRGDS